MFFYYCYADHRDLHLLTHSFPTRRSAELGKDNDWTLTIVRTDLGREIISRMISDGSIVARPGDEDPGAIALMNKLAAKSRDRWPATAIDFPKNRAKA